MGIDDLEAIVQLLDRVRELSVATLSERQASHLFAGERTLLPLVVGFETNT
jgi:lipase chaperone LimK